MARRKTVGARLTSGTKNVANFLFVPQPGSRKVHVTLWIVVPFLAVCTFALFWFAIDPVTWIKTVGEILTYISGLFMGTNAAEGVSNAIIQRKTPEGPANGNSSPAPVPPTPKPGPPVPSPFLKKETQQGGPPIPKPPGG